MKTASMSLLLLGILSTATHAAVTNVNITSLFNADVIINKPTAGVLDVTQHSIDTTRQDLANTGYGLVTQAADTAIAGSSVTPGTGLPDDGLLPIGNLSYAVQLGYSNNANGNNAHYSESDDFFSIFIPPSNNYTTLTFIGTSAEGASDLAFTLHYYDINTDTSTTSSATGVFPDWITTSNLPVGTSIVAGGFDRALNDGSILDPNYRDSFQLFAIEVTPDTNKLLIGVDVAKTGVGKSALLGVSVVGQPTTPPIVPEPATLSLLALGAVAILGRRK